MKQHRDYIYDWLEAVTGLTIWRANQGQDRPEGPYISYQMTNHDEARHPIRITNSDYDNPSTTLKSHMTMTISVNIYDPDGARWHSKLKRSTYNPTYRRVLDEGEISLLNFTPTNDLTELGDQFYRDRYQADYVFNCTDLETFTPHTFIETRLVGEVIREG